MPALWKASCVFQMQKHRKEAGCSPFPLPVVKAVLSNPPPYILKAVAVGTCWLCDNKKTLAKR